MVPGREANRGDPLLMRFGLTVSSEIRSNVAWFVIYMHYRRRRSSWGNHNLLKNRIVSLQNRGKVMKANGELGLFNSDICSQIVHWGTLVHPRVIQKIPEWLWWECAQEDKYLIWSWNDGRWEFQISQWKQLRKKWISESGFGETCISFFNSTISSNKIYRNNI